MFCRNSAICLGDVGENSGRTWCIFYFLNFQPIFNLFGPFFENPGLTVRPNGSNNFLALSPGAILRLPLLCHTPPHVCWGVLPGTLTLAPE